MNGRAMRRLQLLDNVSQNLFCGIFDSLIVQHLFGRVYKGYICLKRSGLGIEQYRLIQPIGLSHSATHHIALVSPFEKSFRGRKEDLRRRLLGTLNIDYIAKRIDKPATPLVEQSAQGSERVQSLPLWQCIVARHCQSRWGYCPDTLRVRLRLVRRLCCVRKNSSLLSSFSKTTSSTLFPLRTFWI